MRTGSFPMPWCGLRMLASVAVASGLARAAAAHNSTWTRGRTTPSLADLVAVDATGEADWPYGQEDLAGDGVAAFTQAEQAIDWRTVYAGMDARRLWVRAYVVNPKAAAPWGMLYVFVDSDADRHTGGPGAAPEIDRGLASDLMPDAGYEHVLAVRGDGNRVALWTYDPQRSEYTETRTAPTALLGTAGHDMDPILGGAEHGYVQVAADRDVLRAADPHRALLFVRATSGITGDRAVGRPAAFAGSDAVQGPRSEGAASNVGSAWHPGQHRSHGRGMAGLAVGIGIGALVGAIFSRRWRVGRALHGIGRFMRRHAPNREAPHWRS